MPERIIKYLVLLLFIFAACKGNGNEDREFRKKSKEIGIVLVDKTAMRVDPLLNSSVVLYMNKGEQVIITDKSTLKTWVGNNEHYWYKVKFANGFSGWIYGMNLKIFPENDSAAVKKFLSKFWERELLKLTEKLSGKWISIKTENGYPEQYLEINVDQKYISYPAEPGDAPKLEGKYSINYDESEITFLDNTNFGAKLNFTLKDNTYFLVREGSGKDIKFKKYGK